LKLSKIVGSVPEFEEKHSRRKCSNYLTPCSYVQSIVNISSNLSGLHVCITKSSVEQQQNKLIWNKVIDED